MQKGIKMDKYTAPITPKEHKVVLLLGLLGIKKEKISFQHTDRNERYFSCGHWLPIKNEDIAYVQEHSNANINEISWYDSDCGWQCYYRIDS